jgi:hypothetical protein
VADLRIEPSHLPNAVSVIAREATASGKLLNQMSAKIGVFHLLCKLLTYTCGFPKGDHPVEKGVDALH